MTTEPTQAHMNEQLQNSADAQPMTVYCLLCPSWTASGTAAETRAASEKHRHDEHPELSRTKVVRRKKKFSSAMTEEREAQIEEERRQRMRTLGIA